jgi:hypothetical protein
MAAYLKVSAIKKMIKSKNHRCSKEFIEMIDRKVEEMVEKTIANTKAITLKELII